MSEGMVSCPGCKAEYDASGYDSGDRFQCPECKTIVTVGGAAPVAAAPRAARSPSRGNTGRTSRGNTGRASRVPMTAKMRVVNEAVGMGALDPNTDPRAIRRAGQAPAPVTDNSSDKMMYIIGGVIAAVACIGAIIYIAKQPTAADKKKALQAKNAASTKEEETRKAAGGGGSSANPDKPKLPSDSGWDIDQAIDAEVQQTLAALKTHPVDAEYAATAYKLLRFGRGVIPPLVESWPKVDPESAEVARQIVVAATGRGIPAEAFVDKLKRLDMAMGFRQWWLTDAGQASKLNTEAEFTRRLTGGAVAVNPNPGGDPTKPPNPEKPPGNGVGEVKKPVGGTGSASLRRDLPQLLSNCARGTFEERTAAASTIRGFGKPVIPALIEELKEEDTAMCGAANDLLKEFTKQDFGKPPGEPGDRPPFIQKWNDWWKGAEASFSM